MDKVFYQKQIHTVYERQCVTHVSQNVKKQSLFNCAASVLILSVCFMCG